MTYLQQDRLRQGLHPDPTNTQQPGPNLLQWSELQRRAYFSPEMTLFRDVLKLPNSTSVRDSIIDDLATFYHMDQDECVQRCVEWERWSVDEWHQSDRESPEGLLSFYHETVSWSFDLLWYAYLQAEGYAYPVSVAITQTLPKPSPGARHLDFGSGVGVTSQLFQQCGYQTDLADISTTLLEFARYRLGRRAHHANYIDLNSTRLAVNHYDVITAIDTLVHVPNVRATVRQLHRALKPGGVLFANFDVRPKTPENAWHLYDNDLPLRYELQRTGFEPEWNLDGMITCYRRVEPRGMQHQLRGVRDVVMLRSPLRPTYRKVRIAAHRLVTQSTQLQRLWHRHHDRSGRGMHPGERDDSKTVERIQP